MLQPTVPEWAIKATQFESPLFQNWDSHKKKNKITVIIFLAAFSTSENASS